MISRSLFKIPLELWLLSVCLLATIYGLLIGSRMRPDVQDNSEIRSHVKLEELNLNPKQNSIAAMDPIIAITENPSDFDFVKEKVVTTGIGDPELEKNNNINFGPVDEWCGEICDITMNGISTKYHPLIRKKVNCESIMKKLDISPEESDVKKRKYGWPPPREPPDELYDRYTMWGQMPLSQNYYFAQEKSGKARSRPITVEEIEIKIRTRAKRTGTGSYGLLEEDILQMALTKYALPEYRVANHTGLDFGSSDNAWLTSMALLNGASFVYMVDYLAVLSNHPKIAGLTPRDLYALWKNDVETRKNWTHLPIDFAISFSSIEHSGLGRYGDELHPEGDLVAMAQLWCLLPPGSILFLNVPFHLQGSSLVWNAHRIYGPNRLQHLTANWEVLDFFDACSIIKDDNCRQDEQITTALWVLKSLPSLEN